MSKKIIIHSHPEMEKNLVVPHGHCIIDHVLFKAIQKKYGNRFDPESQTRSAECNCKLMLDKHNEDIITLSYWICPAHGYKNMHKDQRV